MVYFKSNYIYTICVHSQKWITAISEHAAFSAHYLWGPAGIGNTGITDDDTFNYDEGPEALKPLGSMEDALKAASASHKVCIACLILHQCIYCLLSP